MNERGHQVLAIEAVHDAPVPRDGVGEILYFEGPFEAAGEEAAERADQGAEGGEGDAVDLERVQGHRFPSQSVLNHWR